MWASAWGACVCSHFGGRQVRRRDLGIALLEHSVRILSKAMHWSPTGPPHKHEYAQHQQDGRKNAKAPQQSVPHGFAPRIPVWRHEGQPEFSQRSQCLKHLTMREAPVRWFVADLPGRPVERPIPEAGLKQAALPRRPSLRPVLVTRPESPVAAMVADRAASHPNPLKNLRGAGPAGIAKDFFSNIFSHLQACCLPF